VTWRAARGFPPRVFSENPAAGDIRRAIAWNTTGRRNHGHIVFPNEYFEQVFLAARKRGSRVI
jgi:hypothetical protein